MNIQACFKLNYGVYIVSSFLGEKINGQIANTVFQTTSEPITLAVSINKQNLTHEYISGSGVFAVSVLAQDAPMEFIGTFGFKCGRDIAKFEKVNYKRGITNAPIVLDHTIAYLEANVTTSIDIGTHTLFIGEVVNADLIAEGEPMTYAYYHLIKGGKTPPKAATYTREQQERKTAKYRARYICAICGYIYDPEKGDPDGNIPAGTPFEDIPDDWVCPVCGASKDQFEKE